LKKVVPEFQKEYYLIKQYRALREARIKNKKLKYTIRDVGNATLEIQVKSTKNCLTERRSF
jgi:hypothetical protein